MQRNGKWMVWVIVLAGILVLLVAACAPAATPTAVATKPPPAATTAPQAAPKTSPATPATAATTAAQPTPPAKAMTVRFGSPGSVSDAGVYIGIEKGYFKDLGLDVQVLPFQSGPTMVAPVASGDLDVAGGSINTALFNAIDRGVALKMVAGKGSNIEGFNFSRITVRKDLIDSGQIKGIKDLKGKKIGMTGTKSSPEAIVSTMLKDSGFGINDMDLVVLSYADMLSGYANKAIDAAMQIEPTLTAAVENGLAVRWPPGATSTIYGGEYQAAALVFSEPFSKNIDAARRFMIGYVKGERDYNDAFAKGKDKPAIIAILAKYTSQKDPALYTKMEMPYLNPDGKMHVPSMQVDFDFFRNAGYYTGKTDLKSIIDTQFIDYAVQQLGPYK